MEMRDREERRLKAITFGRGHSTGERRLLIFYLCYEFCNSHIIVYA